MFLENSYFMQLAKTEKPQNWVFLVIHELGCKPGWRSLWRQHRLLDWWLLIGWQLHQNLIVMTESLFRKCDDYCDGGDVITSEVDS